MCAKFTQDIILKRGWHCHRHNGVVVLFLKTTANSKDCCLIDYTSTALLRWPQITINIRDELTLVWPVKPAMEVKRYLACELSLKPTPPSTLHTTSNWPHCAWCGLRYYKNVGYKSPRSLPHHRRLSQRTFHLIILESRFFSDCIEFANSATGTSLGPSSRTNRLAGTKESPFFGWWPHVCGTPSEKIYTWLHFYSLSNTHWKPFCFYLPLAKMLCWVFCKWFLLWC